MSKIRYRGVEADTTFRPLRVGYEALEKQTQRDDKIIRGLQEESENRYNTQANYLNSLQRKFNAESQNLQELQNFEVRTRSTRDEAIQQNKQARLEEGRLQRQADSQSLQVFSELAKFSDTLLKKGLEFKKNLNERDMADEYNKAIAEGLPETNRLAQGIAEEQLKLAGDTTEKIGDIMTASGTDQYTVQQVRSGNRWRDYGRLKAYAEMAADNYPMWLEAQLNKMGDNGLDPMKRAAAIEALQIAYLQQNKLFGLSADFLAPMFTKIRLANQSSISQARESSAIAAGNMVIEDARTALFKNPTPDNLNELFFARSRQPDSNKGVLGPKAGVDEVFDQLVNLPISDRRLTNLLKATKTVDQPTKSWYDRFQYRVNDLMDKRRNNARELAQQEREDKDLRDKETIDGIEAELLNKPFSQQQLDDLIKDLRNRGIDRRQLNRLTDLQAYTTDKEEEKYWNDRIQNEIELGIFNIDSLKTNLEIPFNIRQTWIGRYQQNPSISNQAIYDTENVSKTFKKDLLNAVGQALIPLDQPAARTPSLDLALDYAVREYVKRLQNYSKMEANPVAAQRRALDEVRLMIQEGATAGPNSGNPFYVKELTGKKFQYDKTFGFFDPGGSGVYTNAINATKVATQAKRDGPDVYLSDPANLLVSDNRINAIHDSLENKKQAIIPRVYFSIAEQIPGLNARDVLDLQFKAAGLTPPPRPDLYPDNGAKLIEDPRIQELLNRPTIENQEVATLQGNASWASSNDQAMALIGMATRNGWDPADLAAIFSFETGGTLDPNQPGQGAAEGRIGLIQGGPAERRLYGLGSGDWFREIKAVERYLIARGAQPGMDLRALYEIVNGGSPGAGDNPDGNGVRANDPETLEMLLQHREQAIQRLGMTPRSDLPNDVSYASPTLQHMISGGLTNGKWVPHTDVKQWDNPETAQDEYGTYFDDNTLDNYIELVDPKFGQVTLSELRKRIPIQNTDFYAMRDNGTRVHRGWDYPTAAGTKLALKNGARIIQWQTVPGHGKRAIVKLPDGRFFAFLHLQ